MRRSGLPACVLLSAVALCIVLLAMPLLHWHLQQREQQAVLAQATARLPRRVLWVWERPEDLRTINGTDTGFAILEETLRLRRSATVIPRRQPLILPQGATRIAVVRIDTGNDDDGIGTSNERARRLAAQLPASLASLLSIAQRPGIAALSIDFDARRSERPFYRELLRKLRERMPPQLPLSITALASWCSTDDWIADLPVTEATPMFFRMEPDRRRLLANAPEYRIREPLCTGSVGVSTREPWPQQIAGKRLYIFADHGWAQDLPLLPHNTGVPAPPQSNLAEAALRSAPFTGNVQSSSTRSSSRDH